jgi:Ni/Co efflux regulator RcnB
MKRFLIATTALTLLVAPLSGAFAQGRSNGHDDNRGNNAMMMDRHDDSRGNNAMMQRHDDNRGNSMMRHDNGQHRGWYKGGRIERNDWNRGQRISDYRRYHLNRPPRGYEWRRVDNNYVLAAAATGIIASILLANQ